MFKIIILLAVIIGIVGLRVIHMPDHSPTLQPSVASDQVLDMSGKQLAHIGTEIFTNANLTSLKLENNSLTSVPNDLAKLPKLQILDLSHNNISTLPDQTVALQQLKKLNLTGNPLSADQIDKLRAQLPHTEIQF